MPLTPMKLARAARAHRALLRDGVRQGGRRDRAQPRLRPGPRRRADDLPEHRRARLQRRAAPWCRPPRRCLRSGRTQYTPGHRPARAARAHRAAGTARASAWTSHPQRIVVTAGASAALQLACLALFEPGDEVLMPDPSYPCNRHFVAAAGATRAAAAGGARGSASSSTPPACARTGPPHTRGVLLASPSNPTGTSIAPAEMAAIVEAVRARGGVTLVDEIYLGLSYDERLRPQRAGARRRRHLDQQLLQVLQHDRLAPGLAGAAADAGGAGGEAGAEPLHLRRPPSRSMRRWPASSRASIAEYERRRAEFRRRRDFVVPALQRAGPAGAGACPTAPSTPGPTAARFSASSWDFCFDMMQRAHVALTPGRDFGPHAAERYLRLSFASSMAELRAGAASGWRAGR